MYVLREKQIFNTVVRNFRPNTEKYLLFEFLQAQFISLLAGVSLCLEYVMSTLIVLKKYKYQIILSNEFAKLV